MYPLLTDFNESLQDPNIASTLDSSSHSARCSIVSCFKPFTLRACLGPVHTFQSFDGGASLSSKTALSASGLSLGQNGTRQQQQLQQRAYRGLRSRAGDSLRDFDADAPFDCLAVNTQQQHQQQERRGSDTCARLLSQRILRDVTLTGPSASKNSKVLAGNVPHPDE